MCKLQWSYGTPRQQPLGNVCQRGTAGKRTAEASGSAATKGAETGFDVAATPILGTAGDRRQCQWSRIKVITGCYYTWHSPYSTSLQSTATSIQSRSRGRGLALLGLSAPDMHGNKCHGQRLQTSLETRNSCQRPCHITCPGISFLTDYKGLESSAKLRFVWTCFSSAHVGGPWQFALLAEASYCRSPGNTVEVQLKIGRVQPCAHAFGVDSGWIDSKEVCGQCRNALVLVQFPGPWEDWF